MRAREKLAAALVVMVTVVGAADAARAQDFLGGLFGLFGGRAPVAAPAPAPSMPLSYGGADDEGRSTFVVPQVRSAGASRVAFCVRSCDGRYFPVPASDGENASAVCNSFCPASPTKVMYGSAGGGIDSAATATGQAYTDMPNAYRYRSEIVGGCTCNGKDTFGLAAVKIEDDRTLRKGDIVAGANGLMVATGRADKRNVANFTPAPASIRGKFERMPVVAAE